MTGQNNSDKQVATDDVVRDGNPTPTNPTDPGGTPAEVQKDYDQLALEEAERQAAAENLGGDQPQGGDPGKPNTAEPPPAGAKPAEPPKPAATEQRTVPLERFQEVYKTAKDLEREAIYQKARADALEAVAGKKTATTDGDPPSANADSKPVPSIKDQIKAKRSTLEQLAEKFDNGEITLKEYKRQEAAIEDEIEELRDQRIAEQVKPAGQQQGTGLSMSDEDYLSAQTDKLFETTPELSLDWTEQQMARLTRLAQEDAAARGQPIGKGPRETLRLRQGIAEMAVLYAPRWHGADKVAAIKQQQTGNKQPGQGQQPPAPPARPGANARRQELATRGQHPQDVHQIGTATTGTDGGLTPERFEAMSETEREQLTPDQLRRIELAASPT